MLVYYSRILEQLLQESNIKIIACILISGESARIKRCNGRVFALQDEPDVARVWLPNSDSPGLAMARAFGDFCLKKYGLISVPKVAYRRLTMKDEFVILATDGVILLFVIIDQAVIQVFAATSHTYFFFLFVLCRFPFRVCKFNVF